MIEEEKKHSFMKYLGLFCATLLGAFLAVYFVTDIAINRLTDPFIAMEKMDKKLQKMDREMRYVREITPHRAKFGETGNRINTVNFLKTQNEYKFIVDLKPFNNNPDNIRVIAEDSSITISGDATVDKHNTETFTSFSQTYSLEEGANVNKMTKKKVLDKYIITIPVEEQE